MFFSKHNDRKKQEGEPSNNVYFKVMLLEKEFDRRFFDLVTKGLVDAKSYYQNRLLYCRQHLGL